MTQRKSIVDDLLANAVKDANASVPIPSEEITHTEMMEYLAHARRQAIYQKQNFGPELK